MISSRGRSREVMDEFPSTQLLADRHRNLEATFQALQAQEQDLRQQVEEARQETQDTESASQILQLIAKKLAHHSEAQAASLGTLALREGFPGEELTLQIEHKTKRGQPATEIMIKDEKTGVIGDPLESFGGGPAALLGVMFRAITVVRQKDLRRILLLDEPFSWVSSEYVPMAAKILRKLCEPREKKGLGFDILMITHNKVFEHAAHRRYEATKSTDGRSLILTEKTEVTEKNG